MGGTFHYAQVALHLRTILLRDGYPGGYPAYYEYHEPEDSLGDSEVAVPEYCSKSELPAVLSVLCLGIHCRLELPSVISQEQVYLPNDFMSGRICGFFGRDGFGYLLEINRT